MSVEVLRKALDKFPKTVEGENKDEADLWFEDFKSKFSVFQQAHDKQVHVPRKDIGELIQDLTNFNRWHDSPIIRRILQDLKELLEAGLENIPHEKETAK